MSKYSEKKKRRLENAERERSAVERPARPLGRPAEESPAPSGGATPAGMPSPQRAAPPPAQSGGARADAPAGRPVAPWQRGHGEPPGDRIGGAAAKRAVQSSRTTAAGIGGFGPCGRPICCAGWLKNAEELKVSIRMAKAQTVSLSPESINGYCCQMKCCLSFEYGQEGCAVCPVAKKRRATPVSATPPAAGPAQAPVKTPEGDER